MDNQARTVRDDLLAVDDLYLEGSNYQDPYGGQNPYDEAMELLATAGDDEPIDDGLKEDSDAINAPLSDENDKSQSPQLPPAPAAPAAPAPAATAPQEPVAAMNSQSVTLPQTALMKSALDDLGRPPQVVVTDSKQEWEICDILKEEYIDGVPHYWVQWTVTLVPESDMGKAKVSGLRKFHELAKRLRYVTRHAYVHVLSDCTQYRSNYSVALRRRYSGPSY